MVVAASLAIIAIGIGFACAADYTPVHVAALERWGGGLFMSGLALMGGALGAALPIVH